MNHDESSAQHDAACEYAIARSDVLVLTIAPDGCISYCNAAFAHASGYTRSELIGRPQMLFNRHDMPADVLRDLWATLEAGASWSSVVKSRRKTGERYWLHAIAAPISDAHDRAGYMVVCTRPRRAQVRLVEATYETMRRTARQWLHAVCSPSMASR
ncbi:MAG TPA: PAS domain-containing protein [Ideonella sp.]|uniref:PAS domain-containing protein n=1 Tax=Ideonella sp. TaxID=1929293 RepID=UPI002E33FDA1|nr:PAS domain-containing protein [Ideonella sp.]HEX5686085.1 PAS domain-containing protein [Ideonella sp.]